MFYNDTELGQEYIFTPPTTLLDNGQMENCDLQLIIFSKLYWKLT